MMNKNLRSPFFYVGDKYKLMPQLKELFPRKINTYYEPFLGGGSSALYTEAEKFILNDIDKNVIALHKYISSYAHNPGELYELLENKIKQYKLSCSYLGITVPEGLRKDYKKTYYAKYNKKAYMQLRDSFNKDNDISELYLLLIYGFNRMIRFNSKGEFNVPVGNVDFNNNVAEALKHYLRFIGNNSVSFYCLDYMDFIKNIEFKEGDFVYFDPPYLISNSEYNKLWNESDDVELFRLLDMLDEDNIKFGLSNIVKHKGQHNKVLEEWMKKYVVYDVKSNYISRFDNTIKDDSKEVYITNYEKN